MTDHPRGLTDFYAPWINATQDEDDVTMTPEEIEMAKVMTGLTMRDAYIIAATLRTQPPTANYYSAVKQLADLLGVDIPGFDKKQFAALCGHKGDDIS